MRSEVLAKSSVLFTDRRLRQAESLLSAFNGRLFCVPLLFFLSRIAIKILQWILRGDLTPGWVLNSLGGLRKSLYRKQDHASVSARAAASPLRSRWPKRKCCSRLRCRFYQSNRRGRHRAKAMVFLEDPPAFLRRETSRPSRDIQVKKFFVCGLHNNRRYDFKKGRMNLEKRNERCYLSLK